MLILIEAFAYKIVLYFYVLYLPFCFLLNVFLFFLSLKFHSKMLVTSSGKQTEELYVCIYVYVYICVYVYTYV